DFRATSEVGGQQQSADAVGELRLKLLPRLDAKHVELRLADGGCGVDAVDRCVQTEAGELLRQLHMALPSDLWVVGCIGQKSAVRRSASKSASPFWVGVPSSCARPRRSPRY